MSVYPECERMAAISDDSQKIGEFLEWLGIKGLHVCEVQTTVVETCRHRDVRPHNVVRCINGCWSKAHARDGGFDDLGECPNCGGTGEAEYELIEPRFVPTHLSITELLARYFDIDLDKIEAEKRAMLKALQEAQS